MNIFYGILLLDDMVCSLEIHDEWWRLPESVVRHIPGRLGIGAREVIEFSSGDAEGRLSVAFARAITQRWEGLYSKAATAPTSRSVTTGHLLSSRRITFPALGTPFVISCILPLLRRGLGLLLLQILLCIDN
jgi:DNA ligase-4